MSAPTSPAFGDGAEGRPAPKTTTRRTLRRLRTSLLASTLVLLVAVLVVFQGMRLTADTVRTRTTQAIQEVSSARAALVTADSAAIASFHTGEVALAGPGERYQNQIAIASQSLAQLAESLAVPADSSKEDDADSRSLQLVEGLLVAYTGSIGQADAHYRQGGGAVLGATDLWYASRLLHGAILTELNALQTEQRRVLDHQLSSGWMNPATILVWAVPLGVLLVLLGTTQLYLRRRFRRTVNAPLLVATLLLLLASSVGTWFALDSQHRLDNARGTLYGVVADRHAQMSATDAEGQRALADLVRAHCRQNDGGCGVTVDRFVENLGGRSPTVGVGDDIRFTDRAETVDRETTSAANTATGLGILIPAAALAIALLILLGLHPRIDEYRYRQT